MTKRINKADVTRRIMKVARKLEEFKVVDLVNAYTMGLYHTGEWEERLDSLVSRGTLTLIGGTGWDRVYKVKQVIE